MGRGPTVTKEVETIIIDAWLEFQEEAEYKDDRIPAKLVLQRAHKLNEKRVCTFTLPKVRTVQKIVTAALTNIDALPATRKMLDSPWSLGSCEEYNIAHEVTPSLLQVWWHCLSWRNWRLTIREAKWVARLQSAIKDTHILAIFAHQYARREQLCEILGIPFITTTLDMASFRQWAKEENNRRQERGEKPLVGEVPLTITYAQLIEDEWETLRKLAEAGLEHAGDYKYSWGAGDYEI